MILSTVKVAENPPFGKELLTRFDHMFSVFEIYLYFQLLPFCFDGGISVLILPVPGHCLLVTSNREINNISTTLKRSAKNTYGLNLSYGPDLVPYSSLTETPANVGFMRSARFQPSSLTGL